jgi:hypothetical protein
MGFFLDKNFILKCDNFYLNRSSEKIQLGHSKQRLETWFGVEYREKVSATI